MLNNQGFKNTRNCEVLRANRSYVQMLALKQQSLSFLDTMIIALSRALVCSPITRSWCANTIGPVVWIWVYMACAWRLLIFRTQLIRLLVVCSTCKGWLLLLGLRGQVVGSCLCETRHYVNCISQDRDVWTDYCAH